MSPRRLVLFVEGKGDRRAVPALVGRLLADVGAGDALFLDPEPFRVNGIGRLIKDDAAEWKRLLAAAGKTRNNVGGVLLLLDGDLGQVPPGWKTYINRLGSRAFCAMRAAAVLVEQGRVARAGEAFSLAAVFAMKEFESWLVAGLESLRGVALPEGRGTVPLDATAPAIDLEAKRDAKRLLREQVPEYRETLDQAALAAKVELAPVRTRCRSFRRLDSAIRQLAEAVRKGQPIVSPVLKD